MKIRKVQGWSGYTALPDGIETLDELKIAMGNIVEAVLQHNDIRTISGCLFVRRNPTFNCVGGT